jgi:hypothetical protein
LRTARNLFSQARFAAIVQVAVFEAVDAARVRSLASIPDGKAKIDGIATGDAAANALIAQSIGTTCVLCMIMTAMMTRL